MLRNVGIELDATAHAATQTHAPAAVTRGDALPAGMQLGHFRIERKLGAGGMGEVYLATDLALDRPVAVKVLPAAGATGGARDRLVREARAQARVHHPNVAHIYFIGEDDGRLYFAMEYLEGKTLADRVAAGALSIDDALELVRSAALGLREAERSGFLHRDVKPSNLMVDAHGVLKVLDFGLVAANAGAVADGPVEQTSFAGTPLYMAPEQASGAAIDLRADIYALGATLFHLISGAPPFVAETVAELVSLHASSARPVLPKRVGRRFSTALDRLIARMMAANPADRFASYDELIRAIELVSSRYTRPAGFWVRCFATGVDALIVTAICALVLLPFDVSNVGMDIAAMAFIVYTVLSLAWRHTTPGKALFELELIDADSGGAPRWQRVARRQLLVSLPVVVLDAIKANAFAPRTDSVASIAIDILLYVWLLGGFVDLAIGAWRRPGKRTVWDLVSHTQVRYRRAR